MSDRNKRVTLIAEIAHNVISLASLSATAHPETNDVRAILVSLLTALCQASVIAGLSVDELTGAIRAAWPEVVASYRGTQTNSAGGSA